MALEHHSATEILAFYFPNTHLGLAASGGLWHKEAIGAVTLRRRLPPDPEVTQAVRLAWQHALALLPPKGEPPQPTIVIAPTTELFRQLSISPGYLLAVTRGDQITLQPLPILWRHGPIEPLLLHELLHTLIESQSTDRAPIWLREGLAEALADIHSAHAPRRRLSLPSSRDWQTREVSPRINKLIAMQPQSSVRSATPTTSPSCVNGFAMESLHRFWKHCAHRRRRSL